LSVAKNYGDFANCGGALRKCGEDGGAATLTTAAAT
jgi:hypothetical protein